MKQQTRVQSVFFVLFECPIVVFLTYEYEAAHSGTVGALRGI